MNHFNKTILKLKLEIVFNCITLREFKFCKSFPLSCYFFELTVLLQNLYPTHQNVSQNQNQNSLSLKQGLDEKNWQSLRLIYSVGFKITKFILFLQYYVLLQDWLLFPLEPRGRGKALEKSRSTKKFESRFWKIFL